MSADTVSVPVRMAEVNRQAKQHRFKFKVIFGQQHRHRYSLMLNPVGWTKAFEDFMDGAMKRKAEAMKVIKELEAVASKAKKKPLTLKQRLTTSR